MVIAWPGTGKTQIIAARCANIILKSWVHPENIFITTFTEAWVVAIKERLLQFIGKESYKVYVSTIHSFAQDVISRFPEKFSEEKSAQAIDEIDSLQIYQEILQTLIDAGKVQELRAHGQDMFYLRDVKRTIDKLKQEAISPAALWVLIERQQAEYSEKLEALKTNKRIKDLEKRTQKDTAAYQTHIQKLRELQDIYTQYQRYLRSHELYDFNDMINFVVEKFKADEDLRYYYAERFQYVMLDEYQDTNNAQNEIISQILSVSVDSPNIMVVWDDDQSIYRFQGANVENMLSFHTKYKDVTIVVLEENYRSRQAILDSASWLIGNNFERLVWKIDGLKKELVSKNARFSENENLEKPIFTHCVSDVSEKIFVVQQIQKFLGSWIAPQDIAIITRSNREVEEWTEFLKSQGIEADSKIKTNILQSPFVHFIIDFIGLVVDPYFSDEKLIHLLRTHIIDVENIDIIRMNRYLYNENFRRKQKLKLFDILADETLLDELQLKNTSKILEFRKKVVELGKSVDTFWFLQFFDQCIKATGIIEYIDAHGTFEDLQDVYTLFNIIKDFWRYKKNLTVKTFLEKIELYKTYNFSIERQLLVPHRLGVQVLTAHGSKWLEYEAVFIPGLYLWNWDDKKMTEKIKLPKLSQTMSEDNDEKEEKQKEEDRRLFFVALTRAKNKLFLSAPMMIDGKIKILSEFVEEVRPYVAFEQNDIPTPQELKQVVKNTLLTEKLFSHSEDEFTYIQEFFKEYRLSASDLNVFLENPKSFLHRVIYKYPFEDNEATIFWTVYHEALEYFYKEYKKTGVWWTKEFLLDKFSYLLKREMLTPLEFERLEKKWKEWLSGYYDNYLHNFQEPFFVEYSFRGKNVFFEWVPLTWKIDKVIRLWDGNTWLFQKEEVAVVDYKTGAIKYRWELKWIDKDGNKDTDFSRGKYFRQLLFYKLLCEQYFEFSQNYEVKKLFIDFVEGREGKYKIEDVDFSEEEFTEFKQLVIDSWKKMSSLDFWKDELKK